MSNATTFAEANAPTADQFEKTIGDLFSKISYAMLHRETLVGMAGELVLNGNVPEELGAIVYAMNGLRDDIPSMVLTNLHDSVSLLIERVRSLEVSHV